MYQDSISPITIAISARALFDLEEENRLFELDGLDAYRTQRLANEDTPLDPGPGFPLVRSLLALNELVEGCGENLVDVIVVSRNTPDLAQQIFLSLEHFGLKIQRTVFTGGAPLAPYVKAFDVDLYLSRSEDAVRLALRSGVASAVLLDAPEVFDLEDDTIRIAFDGDAVLFAEESERIYRERGLSHFTLHERIHANKAMDAGPLARFARKLAVFRTAHPVLRQRIRLGLFTARSIATQERVLKTLRSWDLHIDEAIFLGGKSKQPAVGAFRPHIFFDDQDRYLADVSAVAPSGKVPSFLDNVAPMILPLAPMTGREKDTANTNPTANCVSRPVDKAAVG